jgi:hypothetical protein
VALKKFSVSTPPAGMFFPRQINVIKTNHTGEFPIKIVRKMPQFDAIDLFGFALGAFGVGGNHFGRCVGLVSKPEFQFAKKNKNSEAEGHR